MPHLVHIAYGSNIGQKRDFIINALTAIDELNNTQILTRSSLYTSKPWGYSSENEFYNGVCCVSTELSAVGLLLALQRIEQNLGRTSKTSTDYQDRIIDLDIISYGNLALTTKELTIPHPLAHVRNFVLEPMAEISPNWVHPLYLETAESLLTRLNESPLLKVDAL